MINFLQIHYSIQMKKKIILFLIFYCFFVNISSSQKIWSLKDCIEHALENNIQIKQQLLNVELNKDLALQSEANMGPSLIAGGNHVYNYGSTIDRFAGGFTTDRIQSNNFYIQGTVTIFNGFQLLNSVHQSKINLQVSKLDVDKMRNDISLAIATAYLQVLYNIELLDIAQGQLEITKLQMSKTSKLVDAGTLPKGSLLSIQAQAANEELQMVNAKSQLDISKLNLIQLLDIQYSEDFEIMKPEVKIEQGQGSILRAEQIYNFAINNQPEIKSSQLKLQSSLRGLSISKGTRSPNIYLGGSCGTGYSGANMIGKDLYQSIIPIGITSQGDAVYGWDYRSFSIKPFNDQLIDNTNYSFGIYLSFPIFNGLQARTLISRAKIAVDNAKLSLQLTQNQLMKTIQQAQADALAALNKYNATKKSLEALEESFSYMDRKFSVGLVNSIDYNDAKNKLTTAKSQLLQAKYEYVFRMKVLDFYMGQPLELN